MQVETPENKLRKGRGLGFGKQKEAISRIF
jgi:hypothetical protein